MYKLSADYREGFSKFERIYSEFLLAKEEYLWFSQDPNYDNVCLFDIEANEVIAEHRWRKKTVSDKVNHPSHYNTGKIEVIDAILDWKLNFCLGNAIKYIARCEHKENKEEDLKKAIWYIQKELDNLKGED